MVFQSVEAANDAVADLLEEINTRPFQRRDGSREQIFREEEAGLLNSLPAEPFELPVWKKATVQKNCHIAADKHYYSVPYQYVGQSADVRITCTEVTIYIEDAVICTHNRESDPRRKYITETGHLPKGHQKYRDWSGSRFLHWAESYGPFCAQAVRAILGSYTIEEQAYKTLFALLRLPSRYQMGSLNNACEEALKISSRPKLRQIESIMRDQNNAAQTAMASQQKSGYELTRGGSYYSNVRKEDTIND